MTGEPRLAIEEMTVIERLDRLQTIVRRMRDGYSPEPQDVEEVVEGLSNIKRIINECIEDNTPACVHCGSIFTYTRSDGDTGCHDCNGIMPQKPPG